MRFPVQRNLRLRDDHDTRSGLALPRIEPEVPFPACDHGSDVAFSDVVPSECLQNEIRHLLFRVRDLQVDGLRGMEEPVEVSLEFEDPTVVGANALEDAIPIQEAMIEDADLRLRLRVELAVDVNAQFHPGAPGHGMYYGLRLWTFFRGSRERGPR